MSDLIRHSPFAPYDPDVYVYSRWCGDTNVLEPLLYTNWMEETQSWKKSCYLHVFLSGGMACMKVKGPDAEKLMSENFVNNFKLEKFPVGAAKHTIACTKEGYIGMHGMSLRVAEDEFDTYSLDPEIPMAIASGKYNVDMTPAEYDKDFVFQIAGPRSLEVVENVLREDIHDLKFMRFRYTSVLGRKVRVLRMGMGGTLAYELHGSVEDAIPVYEEVMRVGKQYDIKRLGILSYMCNHTENGFGQSTWHFVCAYPDDPEVSKYYAKLFSGDEEAPSQNYDMSNDSIPLYGSMSDQGIKAYYANPIELGWSRLIAWDHDFVGKEALQKIAADEKTRVCVTLEWNPEDIVKIFAAYYDDDPEVPDQMVFPENYLQGNYGNLSDKVVDADGNMIGRSAGCVYTRFYKRTISMGLVDPKFAELGTEVTVIWGTAGTRQIPIRAKVARFPYLNLVSNKDYDMESVPHYKG